MKSLFRLASLTVVAVAATAGLALPAAAIPDPSSVISCLTESVGDLTSLVDPSSLASPTDLPAVGCLTP